MNPGSDEAIATGCLCPVIDNGHGRGYMGQNNVFVMSFDCMMHNKKEEDSWRREADLEHGLSPTRRSATISSDALGCDGTRDQRGG